MLIFINEPGNMRVYDLVNQFLEYFAEAVEDGDRSIVRYVNFVTIFEYWCNIRIFEAIWKALI